MPGANTAVLVACSIQEALIWQRYIPCAWSAATGDELRTCLLLVAVQVDVTSKTEGKVHNDNMLIKYDARLRDNVAVNIVTDVTNAVQKTETGHNASLSVIPTGGGAPRQAGGGSRRDWAFGSSSGSGSSSCQAPLQQQQQMFASCAAASCAACVSNGPCVVCEGGKGGGRCNTGVCAVCSWWQGAGLPSTRHTLLTRHVNCCCTFSASLRPLCTLPCRRGQDRPQGLPACGYGPGHYSGAHPAELCHQRPHAAGLPHCVCQRRLPGAHRVQPRGGAGAQLPLPAGGTSGGWRRRRGGVLVCVCVWGGGAACK
jgi:hypothetical protein